MSTGGLQAAVRRRQGVRAHSSKRTTVPATVSGDAVQWWWYQPITQFHLSHHICQSSCQYFVLSNWQAYLCNPLIFIVARSLNHMMFLSVYIWCRCQSFQHQWHPLKFLSPHLCTAITRRSISTAYSTKPIWCSAPHCTFRSPTSPSSARAQRSCGTSSRVHRVSACR